MTYEEALEAIASLAPRGWRLGLDRMHELVRRAGLEQAIGGNARQPRFIHVAGTNGKGSVTAYLQSMLVESGYRTGAFFSPYVYDPRERIQLGRNMISRDDFAKVATFLWPISESLSATEFGGVTEFEFKTAMGFLYWRAKRCEWVALEVGLGGRLDATNVVLPEASVIVSIGLDHTAVLGGTIEEIAAEKAGVIKPAVPVIVGALPDEALAVIEKIAEQHASPIWRWGREVRVAPDQPAGSFIVETPQGQHCGLQCGIPGAMQGHNLAIAVAAMDAAGATRTLKGMTNGSRRASAPGRFEVLDFDGSTVILDGAHNADAAGVLAESLTGFLWSRPQTDVKRAVRVVLLTAMVEGHDPAAFYRRLAGTVAHAHTVPLSFRRGLAPGVVAEAAASAGISATPHASLQAGFDAAIADAGADGVVLVTGSFYLLGEVAPFCGAGGRYRS